MRPVDLSAGNARHTVTVTLDLESVQFIAEELPQRDGFTREWYRAVVDPLLAEHEQAMRDRGLSIVMVPR